ncbi:MAG TPA: DUF2199 domain-containing protein [Mycobacteriales bacterium]|nr:DUF2199 domain-containing protein [Mycobacteriales bacterium]
MADRQIRYTLPDPVAATDERERAPGTWMSHRDAQTSVMMQVPRVGAFVRALLPVALTDGSTLTFGVWVAIDPDHLQQVVAIWDTPTYLQMALDGRLANAVPPWGMLTAPVHLRVRERRHTPYCDSSTDPTLSKVLDLAWPPSVVGT